MGQVKKSPKDIKGIEEQNKTIRLFITYLFSLSIDPQDQ